MTSVARCLPRNFATSAGFSKQHDTASFDGIFWWKSQAMSHNLSSGSNITTYWNTFEYQFK